MKSTKSFFSPTYHVIFSKIICKSISFDESEKEINKAESNGLTTKHESKALLKFAGSIFGC
jgi:hypothetical protein